MIVETKPEIMPSGVGRSPAGRGSDLSSEKPVGCIDVIVESPRKTIHSGLIVVVGESGEQGFDPVRFAVSI